MTEVQRERFEERGEYDMSFSIPNCGRYRVNAYKQRGSVALAFRLVGTVVPSPEELGVPESVSGSVSAQTWTGIGHRTYRKR